MSWQAVRANAAAERMRSIVMEGFDPAGRAGGVAYLRVTPFAAERALAVPRQPPTIDLTPTSPSPARSRT